MAIVKTHYLNVENLADLKVKLPLLFHQIKQEQDNERLFDAYAKTYEAQILKNQRENFPEIFYQNGKYYVIDKEKYYPFELYPWHTVPDQKMFLFQGKLISSLEIQTIIRGNIPTDTSTGINLQLEDVRNKLAGTQNLYQKIKSLRLQNVAQNRLDELSGKNEYQGESKFSDALKRSIALNQSAVNKLTTDINHLLSVYDFKSIESYSAATSEFLRFIKEKAHKYVDRHLYKYAESLTQEKEKLSDQEYVRQLYQKLISSNATQYHRGSQEKLSAIQTFNKTGSIRVEKQKLEAYKKGEQKQALGKEDIDCLGLFLTQSPDFDYDALSSVKSAQEMIDVLLAEIKKQRDHIKKSRDYMLEGDTVFEFPEIIAQVLQEEGVYEGTVLYSIVMDKMSSKAFDKALHGIALGVLAIAIGLFTYGTGTVALLGAGAVAGIGIYTAIEEIKDYSGKSAAYNIGLTKDAPSIMWVIISIIGILLDAAALKNIAKPLLAASNTFETSKKTIGLEKALSQLDSNLAKLDGITEGMRRNIIKQARLDEEYKKVLKFLKPKYAYLNLTLGLDQFTARITVAAYYAVRKGVLQMDQFIRKVKAEKIIDDFDSLSPEEVKAFKDVFNKAKKDLQEATKNPKRSKEIKRITKRTEANIKLEQGAIDISNDVKSLDVFKNPKSYHGYSTHKITDNIAIDIISNPEAIYFSKNQKYYYYYKDETIVLVYATKSGRGNAFTAYGKAGVKGDSGKGILGGLPTDPGIPVTRKMIEEGKIPRKVKDDGTILYFGPAKLLWE